MKDLKNIKFSFDNSILTLTIDREEKLNALNSETLEELKTSFQTIYDDSDIKGVIITGSGQKAFVAGADITEFSKLNEMNGRKFSEQGQEVFELIENCHVPVIAAVNGYALGGGCELAMACHLRVAVKSAKFSQPEVNLGIIPGYGGTQRLTQLVGRGKAMEWMMTAEMVSGEDALKYGLINDMVESHEELFKKCEEYLHKIIGKAPLAIAMVVDCVNAFYNPTENGYQTEANSFARCCGSEDFKEGTSAFIDKRKPNFQGS